MRITCIFLLLISTVTVYSYPNSITFPNETPLEVQRVHTKSKIPTNYSNKSETTYVNTVQHTTPTESRSRYTFYPGSLKANITQIAKECGWREVVWLPQYDYQWVGQARLSADNIREILAKVLHDFPLQATFYEGNHVLVISPRNIA